MIGVEKKMLQTISRRRLRPFQASKHSPFQSSICFFSEDKRRTLLPFAYLRNEFVVECGGKANLQGKTSQQVFTEFLKSNPTKIHAMNRSKASNRSVYFIHHDHQSNFLETLDRLEHYFTTNSKINPGNVDLYLEPLTKFFSETPTTEEIIQGYHSLSTTQKTSTLILIPSDYHLSLLKSSHLFYHILENQLAKVPTEVLYPLAMQNYSREQLTLLSQQLRDLFQSEDFNLEDIIKLGSHEQNELAFVKHVQQKWKLPIEQLFPKYLSQIETLLTDPIKADIVKLQLQLQTQQPERSSEAKESMVVQDAIIQSKHYLSTLQMMIPSSKELKELDTLIATATTKGAVERKADSASPSSESTAIFTLDELVTVEQRYGLQHFETQRLAFALFPTVLESSSLIELVDGYYNRSILPFLMSEQPEIVKQQQQIYPETKLLKAFLEFAERRTEAYNGKIPIPEQFEWIRDFFGMLLKWIIPILGVNHPTVSHVAFNLMAPHHQLLAQFEEEISSKQESGLTREVVTETFQALQETVEKVFGNESFLGPKIEVQSLVAKYHSIVLSDGTENPSSETVQKILAFYEPIVKETRNYLSTHSNTSVKKTLDDYTFEALMQIIDHLKNYDTSSEALVMAETLVWQLLPLIANEHQLLDGMGEFITLSMRISSSQEDKSISLAGPDYPAYYPFQTMPSFPIEKVLETLDLKDQLVKEQAALEEEEEEAEAGEKEKSQKKKHSKIPDFTKHLPIHPLLNHLGRVYYHQENYDVAVNYFLTYLKELHEFRRLLEKIISEHQQSLNAKSEEGEKKDQPTVSKSRQKQLAKAQQGRNKQKQSDKKKSEEDSLLNPKEYEMILKLKEEVNSLMEMNMIAIYACHRQREDTESAKPFTDIYHTVRNKMSKEQEYATSRELNRYFGDIARLSGNLDEAVYFLEALHFLQSAWKDHVFRSIELTKTSRDLGELFKEQAKHKLAIYYHEEAIGMYQRLVKEVGSSERLATELQQLETSLSEIKQIAEKEKEENGGEDVGRGRRKKK